MPESRQVSINSAQSDRFAFSEEQNKAINHTAGPCEIIAGPGSGKTAVLVQHLLHLLLDLKEDPSSILVLTFSRAAAESMQRRFSQAIANTPGLSENFSNNCSANVSFGTFHSVFFHIISSHRKVTLISSKEQNELYTFLHRFLPSDTWVTTSDIGGFISKYKNTGTSPDPFLISEPIWHSLISEYEAFMKDNHYIDFDDMILSCYSLLQNSEIQELWQKKWTYILIDEFQDINDLQYKTIKLLAGSSASPNLFVVGDDDQSIYGFRGSDPSIMKRFLQDYPSSVQIKLNANYRCHPSIIAASLKVISENNNRITKSIYAGISKSQHTYEEAKYGLSIQKCSNLNEQYTFLAEKLEKMTSEELNSTAIIVRANIQKRGIRDYLLNRSIPIAGSADDIYTNEKTNIILEITKVTKAYTSLSKSIKSGYLKRKDMLLILNRPQRFLSRNILYDEIMTEEELLKRNRSKKPVSEALYDLFRDLHILSGLSEKNAVRYMLRSMRILTEEELTFYESYESLQSPSNAQSSSDKNNKIIEHPKEFGVKLITMHAAKGLEFDQVFIPEINEGMIPSRKSAGLYGIEEERRLFYVAMTRAKKKLTLLYLSGSDNNPQTPSRFLRSLGVKSFSKV